MYRPNVLSAATLALLAGVAVFGMTTSGDAVAQEVTGYINAVDFDITPGQVENYLAAVKENGAASIKEPGCRQFSIAVHTNNPNHVFLYEVYDNEAAVAAHRATDHFKKYAATTASMIVTRTATRMTPIAFNIK